jgi:uracil-DNA glycosylase
MARIANPNEIVNILYDKLKESGWDSIMRMYVKSSDFKQVFSFLLQEVENDDRFTPPVRYLMEPFTHCPYSELKVVFIGDRPYNNIGVSNGLAFSHPVSLSKELPLKVLHNKIAKEVYQDKKPVASFNTDLRVWAEQGVLLLNSSLTTRINNKKAHHEMWEPFISHMIDMLNSKQEGLIYVLFGKNAHTFSEIIDDDENHIIELDYPGDEGYKWDSGNMFNKINEILEELGKQNIVW